ncbi:PD-(D/E)XK nuclease family protein [Fodinicurvata halophila]|uniref:PD-(D/E)XK nuclease family protein n=1 Tax=Fodinicurvata halophila TaxID=1419723 RepID=A0ABV8UQG3_9PROT
MPETLFNRAPSEMSHSAFWAWFFDSLNATSGKRTALAPHAKKTLNELGLQNTEAEITIRTEVKSSKGSRYDITIESDNEKIIIENKVKSTPSNKQLQLYSDHGNNNKTTSGVLFSLAFDQDVRADLSWPYFGLDEMIIWLERAEGTHDISDEYLAFLKRERDYRYWISSAISSNDANETYKAFEEPSGQWLWMHQLCKGIGQDSSQIVRGTNNSGAPWTQIHFADAISAPKDCLFYRLDHDRNGYYLAIRQYNSQDHTTKRDGRLEHLSSSWKEAAEEENVPLTYKSPRNRRKNQNERTVVHLSFKDNKGPKAVLQAIPGIHKKFIKKLLNTGQYTVRTP